MSSIVDKVIEVNFRRSLAHIFPGFLLYLGLLLAIDTFLTTEDGGQTWVTAFLFKPSFANAEVMLSVIGIGIFVGYILGILIDGVGHSFLDDKINRDIGKWPLSGKHDRYDWTGKFLGRQKELNPCDNREITITDKYHTLSQAESATFKKWIDLKGINKHCEDDTSRQYLSGFPKSHFYLYPFTYQGDEDKVNLLKFLIDEYYSFYEFYRNSGISILVVSTIFPFYLMKIQHLSYIGALMITSFMLLASALLFYAALNAQFSYRTTRLFSIEGLLRKGNTQAENNEPETKITGGIVTERVSGDVQNKQKSTSSINWETKV